MSDYAERIRPTHYYPATVSTIRKCSLTGMNTPYAAAGLRWATRGATSSMSSRNEFRHTSGAWA